MVTEDRQFRPDEGRDQSPGQHQRDRLASELWGRHVGAREAVQLREPGKQPEQQGAEAEDQEVFVIQPVQTRQTADDADA